MPTVRCSVCGRVERLSTKKWKFLIGDEPYVCSADCVEEWILRSPQLEWACFDALQAWVEKEGGRCVRPPGVTEFRSEWERRFSLWLMKMQYSWTYERFAFPVNSGFYIPDFAVGGYKCFLETKGLWQTGARKKFKRFQEAYPQVPILIIPWTLNSKF